MTNSQIHVGIVHYPGAMLSAVQGLAEQFYLANQFCSEHGLQQTFKTYTCDSQNLEQSFENSQENFHVVILPPCLYEQYYLKPQSDLIDWLQQQHKQGAIICSVCAGAFILAETGLLDGRKVTSHWKLADDLARNFPNIQVDSSRLLINDTDIITSGGLMSWVDLGLELVALFTNSKLMRQLGRFLLVDTGSREQSYYQSFCTRLDHGDEIIIRVQHQLQKSFHQAIKVSQLAETVNLTERTFLRRFVNATGLKPTQYIQRLRIQKACELIESTTKSIERVAADVGYEDVSAFRKMFIKITEQTPREYKNRFVRSEV
ncbi:GlxA family transcriptional regulator [Sessilibacter corallicola]